MGVLLPGGDVDCVVWTCCEDGCASEGAVTLEFCGVGCCEDVDVRWSGEQGRWEGEVSLYRHWIGWIVLS